MDEIDELETSMRKYRDQMLLGVPRGEKSELPNLRLCFEKVIKKGV